MLGASISKEKVKSLTVPRLFVNFSLLLLLQSCDWQNTADLLRSNTVVIFHTYFSFWQYSCNWRKLTLEKQFKTDNNECVERGWKLIFNEFVKCAVTNMELGYDLKNFLTWKRRLLIRTVFVLIDVKTECSTWSSTVFLVRVRKYSRR